LVVLVVPTPLVVPHWLSPDPEADKDTDVRQWKCLAVLRAGGVKEEHNMFDACDLEKIVKLSLTPLTDPVKSCI